MGFPKGRPSITPLIFFILVPTYAFRRIRREGTIVSEPELSEIDPEVTASLEELFAKSQNILEEEDDDCPPDGDKCCTMKDLWQTKDFLRQSLGMGIEQCFQLNIDLAQAFATAALYVPIQIVFAMQGVYDFGFGAGSSGNMQYHRMSAERRKATGSVSAAVQITIIPKVLYVYVSMTYQVQAYQRDIDTHPYILSMKEIISLVTRSLLGRKYLTMRFSGKPQPQYEFVASLLDMYTFTDGFPTDNIFLDRYDALVDQASRSMIWPDAAMAEEAVAELSVSNMRKKLLTVANELKNNFGSAFWNLDNPRHHIVLFDCYTYYEAFLDTVYATDIGLTGQDSVTLETLVAIRKERDSAENRYKNESFIDGFSSGGSYFSSRGKHKRREPDPLYLCDKHQDTLKCRQRLAMCLSLNYDPVADFEASELKGKWPPQFLNSFPEVVAAMNDFEFLYKNADSDGKKAVLIPQAFHALKKMTEIQFTFMTLFRAREGTLNACEVRKCSESGAGEESGELIVENLEDDDGDDSTDLTTAKEVEVATIKLMDGPWRGGLPSGSSGHTLYYAHAPPEAPGKGLGGMGACLSKSSNAACSQWTKDVQEWGRSEQAMWAAIQSGDGEKVTAACSLPDLQFHLRNPFSDGLRFIELARDKNVEQALRDCPSFDTGGAEAVGAPIHFRPYVVQRLWMRTVAQAHLAIDQHHKELKHVQSDNNLNPTTYKAFSLEYSSTVSFEATLDLAYIDFCKGTGAPIAVGAGRTWTGKLLHEYSPEEKRYVMRKIDHEAESDTKKFQIVMPDGSVKYFAEWGKGTTSDDFDLVELEQKYELEMTSPGVMTAFLAVLGLSAIVSRIAPFVSKTITGEVVKEAHSEEGLSLNSLGDIIASAWEKQASKNASSSVSQWFSSVGSSMLKVAQNRLACTLGLEAAGMFLVRALTMNSVQSIAGMIGTIGASKAQDLYETSPVYAGAWFTGRLDMLVSHTAEKCHKLLRPQLKSFFRAGFNAPFVSGAYTAAFYVRISLPLTPKNMVLPDRKGGGLRRKQYCGLLGTPGRFKSCKDLRGMWEILDEDRNQYITREELVKGFNNNEAIADALLGENELIGWKSFYKHFGFTSVDCKKVDDAIAKKIKEGNTTGSIF